MTHKVSVEVEDEYWIRFKEKASQKGRFKRGYTGDALKKAIMMYLCFDETHMDFNALMEVGRNKYPDMEYNELIKTVFDECKEMYLEKNKDYLD